MKTKKRMLHMLREIPGIEFSMPKGAFYVFPCIQ
jgi:aspartate/methionine/tyrosine aminotransferase